MNFETINQLSLIVIFQWSIQYYHYPLGYFPRCPEGNHKIQMLLYLRHHKTFIIVLFIFFRIFIIFIDLPDNGTKCQTNQL